jgi:hypothetical protein
MHIRAANCILATLIPGVMLIFVRDIKEVLGHKVRFAQLYDVLFNPGECNLERKVLRGLSYFRLLHHWE